MDHFFLSYSLHLPDGYDVHPRVIYVFIVEAMLLSTQTHNNVTIKHCTHYFHHKTEPEKDKWIKPD